jgi:hypothetical protein
VGFVETVAFRGHQNICATHPTTLEITTDESLSRQGNCIIGVRAEKGCSGLSERAKTLLQKEGKKLTISIRTGSFHFSTFAFGCSALTLKDPKDIVIRKSNFVCARTACLRSQAAARDVPRNIVQGLKSPNTVGLLHFQWDID